LGYVADFAAIKFNLTSVILERSEESPAARSGWAAETFPTGMPHRE
jgi:hypothetical protein